MIVTAANEPLPGDENRVSQMPANCATQAISGPSLPAAPAPRSVPQHSRRSWRHPTDGKKLAIRFPSSRYRPHEGL